MVHETLIMNIVSVVNERMYGKINLQLGKEKINKNFQYFKALLIAL